MFSSTSANSLGGATRTGIGTCCRLICSSNACSPSDSAVTLSRSEARAVASTSAIAPSGSNVARIVSASSAVRSVTRTGIFWSPLSSCLACPSISIRPSGVSIASSAPTNPISDSTARRASICPAGWRLQFAGFGIRLDAFTRFRLLIRSRNGASAIIFRTSSGLRPHLPPSPT